MPDILSERSIVIIAGKTSYIREFEIKNIAALQSIDNQTYQYILEHYKDPSSSSKEAKIQGILRYLKRDSDKLIGFAQGLIQANTQFLEPSDIEEINQYLLFDSLRIDDEMNLIPTREMPERALQEEMTDLEQKLNDLGFASSVTEYRGALEAIPDDPVSLVTHLRRFLEELLREVIVNLGASLEPTPVRNRDLVEQLLNFHNPTGRARSNLRTVLDGMYGMLSELGSHPPLTASFEERLFLVHVTIELGWLLLHLFENRLSTP